MASDESVNMPELKEDSDIDDDQRGEYSDGGAGHSIGMFKLQLSIKRSFRGGLNQKQQLKELPIKGQASEKESQINQKDFILYGQKKISSIGGGNNYNLGNSGFSFSFSYGGGESKGVGEGEGEGGGGVVVITRPKGGRRSLFMDLDEVKACRELGFELEHEDKIIVPARPCLSTSGSTTTLHTSGCPNSPVANWPISTPGDNPRDVKARLRVWAQAVALASLSRQS